MSAYSPLARWYDALTADVPYERFAALYERLFAEAGGVGTVLDLACGTGTVTALLAARGYEMIAADPSPDMLAEAAAKLPDGKFRHRPLLLCQSIQEIDLYGTVDATVCALDAVNYVPPVDLPEALRRLRMFIRPGGLFVFDILSPATLRALDGAVSVDEARDVFCVWRASLVGVRLIYDVDIFERRGESWSREAEEHTQYIYKPEALLNLLRESGFSSAEIVGEAPMRDSGRVFIRAVN